MAKLLFLDIDGVLNSDFWTVSHQREISDGTLIDEEKVCMLANLVKKMNAKIILHSGWRFWFDNEIKPCRKEAEKLVELLGKYDLSINGLTPDLTTAEIRKAKKFSLVKANEILSYLELHKTEVTEWVVLDDLDLHNLKVKQHQVKTEQRIGLTQDDIKKAEMILMGKINHSFP